MLALNLRESRRLLDLLVRKVTDNSAQGRLYSHLRPPLKTTIDPNAKPVSLNALLTGDHDRGTLNSEFFVKYSFHKHWAAKVVYQFLFVEYETSQTKQTFSDGSMNNRFRNKANNFGIGVAYHF